MVVKVGGKVANHKIRSQSKKKGSQSTKIRSQTIAKGSQSWGKGSQSQNKCKEGLCRLREVKRQFLCQYRQSDS